MTISDEGQDEQKVGKQDATQEKVGVGKYRYTPKSKTFESQLKTSGGQQKRVRQSASKKQPYSGKGRSDPSKKTKLLLPDDPDHQWLKKAIRSAETVAQVLSVEVQFQNKIRALKLHHPLEKPLHQYALRMEKCLLRLRTYPWQTLIRDIRQDDPVVKGLRL